MPARADATDIPDDADLWRRIDKRMLSQSPTGVKTLQSWAWKDQNKEISVYVVAETVVAKVLSAGKPEQILIKIKAGSVRKLGRIVTRDPEPDNAAHCLILPYPTSRAEFRALADKSFWD